MHVIIITKIIQNETSDNISGTISPLSISYSMSLVTVFFVEYYSVSYYLKLFILHAIVLP